MSERDPKTYEELEFLEGLEEAMDADAPLDELGVDERFPVDDEEYSHGAVEEIADVEGFRQPWEE